MASLHRIEFDTLQPRPSSDPTGSPTTRLVARTEYGSLDTETLHRLAAAMASVDVAWLHRLESLLDARLCHNGDVIALYRSVGSLASIYYTSDQRGPLACNEAIAPLLHMPQPAAAIDREALHEFLRFGDITMPRTIYAAVRAVETGCLVRRDGTVRRVATETSGIDHAAPSTLEAATDRLRELLEAGIRERLADSRRPGAFLSGGIDSALICAIAARERPDLTAVTVGFEGERFDEAPVAGRIAAHLGLRHEVLRFGREQLLGAFDRLATHADQPFADPAGPVTLLAFEHCRRYFDVVLDGTGADAAVGAMPPRHLRLAVAWAGLLPTALRLTCARLLEHLGPLAGYAPILDFEHPADTMIRWNGFTRAEIEALCGEPVSFAGTTFYRTFERFARNAHFERYSALMAVTPDDRVAQALRITAVDARFPFCDRDTDCFIRQLRTEFKHLPGEPKRILGALLARYVPRTIWDGPKHGFNFPLEDFLRSDDGWLVRQHLAPERWRLHGLLSPEGVDQYARRFLAGDSRLTFRTWVLIVLGAWLERRSRIGDSNTASPAHSGQIDRVPSSG